MSGESSKCNTKDRGPSRTTWPPAWLAGPTEPMGPQPVALPRLTAATLPADLRETWEERACIMHHDGSVPWDEAEVLALTDVLDNARGLTV